MKGGIYEDNWVTFTREWDIFKAATTIPAAAVPVYLLSCCDQDLKTDVHKEDPTIHTKMEAEVLATIKKLAVAAVAKSVQQTELLSLSQEHGERIRVFAAHVKGKAQTCGFSQTCSRVGCNTVVDYCPAIVKLVFLSGLADEDIKREVLGTDDMDNMDLVTTIGLIKTKE